jgi:hypothetical protein
MALRLTSVHLSRSYHAFARAGTCWYVLAYALVYMLAACTQTTMALRLTSFRQLLAGAAGGRGRAHSGRAALSSRDGGHASANVLLVCG